MTDFIVLFFFSNEKRNLFGWRASAERERAYAHMSARANFERFENSVVRRAYLFIYLSTHFFLFCFDVHSFFSFCFIYLSVPVWTVDPLDSVCVMFISVDVCSYGIKVI